MRMSRPAEDQPKVKPPCVIRTRYKKIKGVLVIDYDVRCEKIIKGISQIPSRSRPRMPLLTPLKGWTELSRLILAYEVIWLSMAKEDGAGCY